MNAHTLPEWLVPAIERFPTTHEKRELKNMVFEMVFERTVEQLAEGRSLLAIVKEDPRNINYHQFQSWIKKDPDRKQRSEQAREDGPEYLMEQCKEIADAENSSEDVQRSRLRIEVRKMEMMAWNRKRYGERAQVENNVTIDLRGAMEEGNRRALVGRYVPVTVDGDGVTVDG